MVALSLLEVLMTNMSLYNFFGLLAKRTKRQLLQLLYRGTPRVFRVHNGRYAFITNRYPVTTVTSVFASPLVPIMDADSRSSKTHPFSDTFCFIFSPVQ